MRLIIRAIAVFVVVLAAAPARAADPLPSWNDGPTKTAILDFVRTTTDRASPKYVPPEERVAAAALTNVPRSLAAAVPPLLVGALLQASSFGWPLIIAGTLKAIYDLLLLWGFQHRRPPEPAATAAAPSP